MNDAEESRPNLSNHGIETRVNAHHHQISFFLFLIICCFSWNSVLVLDLLFDTRRLPGTHTHLSFAVLIDVNVISRKV